jgi:hypothetical protein
MKGSRKSMDVIALGLDGFATTVSGQIFPLALALWCECCYSIKGWASHQTTFHNALTTHPLKQSDDVKSCSKMNAKPELFSASAFHGSASLLG